MEKTHNTRCMPGSTDWRNQGLVCFQRYCELAEVVVQEIENRNFTFSPDDFRDVNRHYHLAMLEVPLWYNNLKLSEPSYQEDYFSFSQQVKDYLFSLISEHFETLEHWTSDLEKQTCRAVFNNRFRQMQLSTESRQLFDRFVSQLTSFCHLFAQDSPSYCLFALLDGGCINRNELHLHANYLATEQRELIALLYQLRHTQPWFSPEQVEEMHSQSISMNSRRIECLQKWWNGTYQEWQEFARQCIKQKLLVEIPQDEQDDTHLYRVINRTSFLLSLLKHHRIKMRVAIFSDGRDHNAATDTTSAVDMLKSINASISGGLTEKNWQDAKRKYKAMCLLS